MVSIRKKLNPLISAGKKQESLLFIDRFSRELKESFRVMREIFVADSSSYRDLNCLDRLENFYPLLLKSFKLDTTPNKANFEITCKFLEIYSFRVFAVQQNRSNTGQTTIYKLAKNFSGGFEPLFDNLKKIIGDLSTRKRFHDTLNDADLYNWMSSRDLCYLIWKYENHLRKTEQPVCSSMTESEFRSVGSKTRLRVEHIASQKKNGIVEDTSILPELDTSFKDTYLHSLGNLTFDPNSSNSSKSNNEIQIKKSKYFSKAPYKTQNELESFMLDGKWAGESIRARQLKVVEFCLKHWSPQYVPY
jgi:hypothetical protein